MKNKRWIDKYRDKLHPKLQEVMNGKVYALGTNKRGKIPVIVTFKPKMTKASLLALKKRLGLRHVAMKNRMASINAVSANITRDGVRKLCGEHCVKCLYLDRKVKMYLNVATPAVGSLKVHKAGLTGRNVGIAVIDTGIHSHPDLTRPTNRIVTFKDFVNRRRQPYDDNGHGTHVAGIAAGNGTMSKGKYKGQATRAKLIGIKVLDRNGSGLTSDVIRGIEWAIKHRKRYNIRVINLSFGYDRPEQRSDDPLYQITSQAWKAGLVVVAAAGNSGPRARTIGSPGNNPLIITVGAVNDRNTIRQSDDRVAAFSSRGKAGRASKPDVVAPGVNIMSLRIPRSYKRLSGTSMATPIVSGIAALILQRHPKWKPGQVKRVLKQQAYKLSGSRNAKGSGEVNVRFLLGKI